jgi:hypothetical protein
MMVCAQLAQKGNGALQLGNLLSLLASSVQQASSSRARQLHARPVLQDHRKHATMSRTQNVKYVRQESSLTQPRPPQVNHVPYVVRTRLVMRVLIVASHVHMAPPARQALLVVHVPKDLERTRQHMQHLL